MKSNDVKLREENYIWMRGPSSHSTRYFDIKKIKVFHCQNLIKLNRINFTKCIISSFVMSTKLLGLQTPLTLSMIM